MGGIRNRDFCRPSNKYNIPKAKKVREVIDMTGNPRGNNTNAMAGGKKRCLKFNLGHPRRQRVAIETSYLLRVRSGMSATVCPCRNDAIACIGQISKLSNHGPLGTRLVRGDERR